MDDPAVLMPEAPLRPAKNLRFAGEADYPDQMAQTCRQYRWNLQGKSRLNFNWDAINHDSVVLVTASEYAVDASDPKHSPRFVGAATITVGNISPHGPPFDPNHGVTFIVDVDWGSPLHVVTDITVLDAAPVDIEYQNG